MSKAVKTVVAVAASVAIPFVAPAIASSIGLSAAIGATAGSALVGAGLGAASSALTGGDVKRGALMGGVTGGIAGYTSVPSTATSAGTAGGASAGGGTGLTMPPAGAETVPGAGVIMPSTGTPYDFGMGVPLGGGTGLQLPSGFGGGTGLRLPSGLVEAGVGAGTQAASGSFLDALKQVPGQIAAKFTDPKVMADLTLRAAGRLAGPALAGSGLSDQEQALLNAQTEELRTLQQTNADLFRQRLSQAQGLIGESRYFDPEYFGLQSARRAQLAGAQAKRAGLRGLEGERRAAEARRFELATGRDVGTAYDVGFGTGVQGRLQTMQTGIGLMPTGYPSSMGDYANLQRAYAGAEQQRERRQQQIGSLFGLLTGEQKAKKKGEEAV